MDGYWRVEWKEGLSGVGNYGYILEREGRDCQV